jgi:hypothetical protein
MGCPTHLSFMPRVNLSNYEGGREQAYVKHSLLEIYLPELAFRVGKKWGCARVRGRIRRTLENS